MTGFKDTLETLVKDAKEAKVKGKKYYKSTGNPITLDLIHQKEELLKIKFPKQIQYVITNLSPCYFGQLTFFSNEDIRIIDDIIDQEDVYLVVFASDVFGNFLSFNPISNEETIYYLSHDPIEVTKLFENITELMFVVKREDYNFSQYLLSIHDQSDQS